MNKRLKSVLILPALGIGYFVWLKLTDIAIPCLFRKITGLLCPGCGITTMVLCLADFDFKGAFAANPFLFVTSPFLIAELTYYFAKSLRDKTISKNNEKIVIVYCILFCSFGIARNVWRIL